MHFFTPAFFTYIYIWVYNIYISRSIGGVYSMSKKDLDWWNLGFQYRVTDKRYVSNYKDGFWDQGGLIEDPSITVSESANIMQYCQEIFEGMKAYETVNGEIVTFRPDLNAKRMISSAKRMCMPPFPEDRFLEAVDMVVSANADWVPPMRTGASLYIRPFMIGTGAVIGVQPAKEFQFRIFCTPVGPYFKGGAVPVAIRVCDYDRAAPHGTGNIKAGLNYAMSLFQTVEAHNEGYAENMYLDPSTRTLIEETGGSNIFFVTEDRKIVIPASRSILPSITRRSVAYVAENMLGYEVEQRPVELAEVSTFTECGLCGTAAVISPVGRINDHGRDILLPSGMEEPGPVTEELYRTLTGIQYGTIEAPKGWIHVIKL